MSKGAALSKLSEILKLVFDGASSNNDDDCYKVCIRNFKPLGSNNFKKNDTWGDTKRSTEGN